MLPASSNAGCFERLLSGELPPLAGQRLTVGYGRAAVGGTRSLSVRCQSEAGVATMC